MPKALLPHPSGAEKDRIAGFSLSPAIYVSLWIVFSNLTILFNKWLIDNAGFPYPVFLAVWHMVFATLVTQFLAQTTRWLDGRHQVQMTRRLYMRTIVPIGILYSGSMVCSNLVYMYLSVAFIQMLKAAAPFFTLLMAWVWGQEDPTREKVVKVLIIVSGVLLSSMGEIHFSIVGLIFQLGGLVFESLRIVMVKDLMTDAGANMDPLVSLYYYAPMCAVTNLVVALGAEWPTFRWTDVEKAGLMWLTLNAAVAFCLNVAGISVIDKTSALISQICGVLKNILLMIASVVIWGTRISPIQIIGYSIALTGMVFYRATWHDVKREAASSVALYKKLFIFKLKIFSYRKLTAHFRRIVVAIVVLLLALAMLFAWAQSRRTEARL